jgi:AraC-like DNA-binding protein
MRTLLVYLSFLVVVWSCSDSMQPEFLDLEAKQKHDPVSYSYIVQIAQQTIECPDSALELSLEYIDFLSNRNDYPGLVNAHSSLSELYQYRLYNPFKAFQHLQLAIDAMVAIPQLQHINPYVLINIGNILLYYDAYADAIEIYSESARQAQLTNIEHAEMLSYNNIGLAYSRLNHTDSAFVYFLRAKEQMPDAYRTAYFYFQVNQMLANQSNVDSLKVYYDATEYHLNQLHTVFCSSENDRLMLEREAYGLHTQNALLYARYLVEREQVNEADSILDLARGFSDKALHPRFRGEVAELSADIAAKKGFFQQSSVLAKDALNNYMAQGLLSLGMSLSDKMIALLEPNAYELSRFWEENQLALYRMLQQQQLSRQQEAGIISLSKSGLWVSLKQLTHVKNMLENDVKLLTNYNVLLLTVLLIFVVMILQNRILRNTKLRLARRTSQLIQQEEENQQLKKGKCVQNPDGVKGLMEEVERLMQDEKLYTQAALTLSTLATLISTNTTYLSQSINHYYPSFKDYLNDLRIRDACKKIEEGLLERFTINHLFESVGFSSKSAFYSAFRKFTGVSPVEYQRQIKTTNIQNPI